MRVVVSLILVSCMVMAGKMAAQSSDRYIRNRVFLLTNPGKGSCTGVQVVGIKSKKPVILTAAHCISILTDKKLIAVSEDGVKSVVELIAEDVNSDLMLLTSANDKTIEMAKSVSLYQAVHTLTHGRGLPTYRTDGVALNLEVPMMPIDGVDLKSCLSMPKYSINLFGCMLIAPELVTTAWIVPGSSGGPLLNARGQLIGIASGGTIHTSIWVPISDVLKFLSDK